MVCIDAAGARVEVDPSPVIAGSDREIRGKLVKYLIDGGVPLSRVTRIIGKGRSQLYEDLGAARRAKTA